MRKGVRVISVIFALAVIGYLVFQSMKIFKDKMFTESAYSYTVTNSCSVSGLIIRNEEQNSKPVNGYISYIAENGTRTVPNTVIAKEYSSESDCLAVEGSEIIKDEIARLGDIKEKQEQGLYINLEDEKQKIYAGLNEISYRSSFGYIPEIADIKADLYSEIVSTQAAVGKDLNLDEVIAALTDSLPKVKAKNTVTAGKRGYFSDYTDGYESELTIESAETLTPQQFDNYMELEYTDNDSVVGKNVKDHNWLLAVKVPFQTASNAFEGMRVNVSAAGHAPIESYIKRIEKGSYGEDIFMILSCNEIFPEMLESRKVSVTLDFKDYVGVRFPKKALRILDGQKGVYISGKSSVEFKLVDIIYTGEDFYLSRISETDRSLLTIYDEVIVEGAGLYHGQSL